MYEYKQNTNGRWECTGKIIDKRELLKIKIKSLAAEAKIIRHEERKTFGAFRDEMHHHRVEYLRRIMRDTHIAYGLIRGRTYEQMEPTAYNEPNWEAVRKMVKQYGPRDKEVVRPGHLKAA